jgi:hypothetical protein
VRGLELQPEADSLRSGQAFALLRFAPSKVTEPCHSEERSDEESAFAVKKKQIPRFARNDRAGGLSCVLVGRRPMRHSERQQPGGAV